MGMQVTQTNAVTAVSLSQETKGEGLQLPPSEELIEISARLKEAIEGLSAWIQLYALLQSPDNLSPATKELTRLDSIFQNAHSELLCYSQQIPEPTDGPLAYQMLLEIEKCFLEEIDRETACEINPYGFTSWGALMLSTQEVIWNETLVQALFDQIASNNWRTARHLLSLAQSKLP